MKKLMVLIICLAFIIGCTKKDTRNEVVNSKDTIPSSGSRFYAAGKEDSTTLQIKAALAYDNQKYDSAAFLYGQLIQFSPKRGQYYYRRGISNAQLHLDSLAVRDLLAAIDLKYETFDAYRVLGLIYMFNNETSNRALFYFEKCLEIKPGDNEIVSFIKEIKRKSPSESRGL